MFSDWLLSSSYITLIYFSRSSLSFFNWINLLFSSSILLTYSALWFRAWICSYDFSNSFFSSFSLWRSCSFSSIRSCWCSIPTWLRCVRLLAPLLILKFSIVSVSSCSRDFICRICWSLAASEFSRAEILCFSCSITLWRWAHSILEYSSSFCSISTSWARSKCLSNSTAYVSMTSCLWSSSIFNYSTWVSTSWSCCSASSCWARSLLSFSCSSFYICWTCSCIVSFIFSTSSVPEAAVCLWISSSCFSLSLLTYSFICSISSLTLLAIKSFSF